MVNSLKNRIWLAVSGVAAAACGLGVLLFIAASYFITAAMFILSGAFLIAIVAAVLVGRWLSHEVVRPVEKLNLAAKSLERNPTATLPKTTGTTETDDLLRSLHRNSLQMQNLIVVMDDVASGKTAAALKPLQDSDRLTVSFQKIVSKVTDSIDAKQELDDIRAAVARLASDVAPVRYGNLNVEVRASSENTREIAEVLDHLIKRLDRMSGKFRENSDHAVSALAEVRDLARVAAEEDTARSARFGRAFSTVTETPNRYQALIDQFAPESASPEYVRAKFASARDTAAECAGRLRNLRVRSNESFRKYQRVRERFVTIPKLARTAEEIARRSNLIALNSAIGNTDTAQRTTAGVTVSDELSRLSVRAEKLSREMAEFSKSAIDEANEVESGLNGILSEMAEITMNSTAAADAFLRFDPLLSKYFDLPAQLSMTSSETGLDRERNEKVLRSCRENDVAIRTSLESATKLVNALLARFEEERDWATDLRMTTGLGSNQSVIEITEAPGLPAEMAIGEGGSTT